MTQKICKLCLVGINFRESAKRIFLRPFNFANSGVIREIREIFWTRNFLTLKYFLFSFLSFRRLVSFVRLDWWFKRLCISSFIFINIEVKIHSFIRSSVHSFQGLIFKLLFLETFYWQNEWRLCNWIEFFDFELH